MKKILVLSVMFLQVIILYSQPLSGIKTIPGDYPSIQAAISALNTYGVNSGGVTINVAAGWTETLTGPATGMISYTCIPANYSSLTSPVVFQKSGSGANPLITAFFSGTSTSTDGIIIIAGADYVTFDGIDLQENPLNTTPTMQMEWGYALVKKNSGAPVDGCQYVTIRNCAITLSKANTGSIGIHTGNHVYNSTSVINYSLASDAHNNCKFYGNSISNVYNGIDVEGCSALYDQNMEIGVTAGNHITNFAGGAGNPCGIFALYQENLKIAGNTITGGNGSTGYLYGIYTGTGNSSNVQIWGNLITLTPTSSLLSVYGIRNTMGSGSSPNTVSIYNNTLENFTSPVSCSWPSSLISQEANAAMVNIYGNIIRNCSNAGGNYYYGIFETSNVANGTRNIYNNQIYNITNSGSVTINAIDYIVSSTTTGNIYNNTVHGIYSAGGSNKGMMLESGGTTNVYKNRIYDISTDGNGNSGQGLLTGLYVQGITTANIYNNYITDLKAPTTAYGYSADAVDGIFINTATNCNLIGNTVFLNTSSVYTNFRTACISISGNAITSLLLKNNIMVNLSGASGTGNFATAFRRANTSLTNYALSSDNNLFYAGTPGPNHLIFEDYTNADQNLAAFKTRVSPREANSISEMPPFVNAAGYDFHLIAGAGTACESGGQVVSSPFAITDDWDGDPRYPNAGYPNNAGRLATAPDIGADEFAGLSDNTPPTITYTPLSDPIDNLPRTLTALIIDAGLGVPVGGSGLPMLYWKKTGDPAYAGVQGVSIGSAQYTFTFGGGASSGNIVSYYIVAQDMVVPPNVSAYPSTGVSGFSSTPPSAATPPSNPSTYTIQSAMTGTWTIPGDFQTIQAAIATLNLRGVDAGGVIFNVAANYTETFTSATGGLINYTCSSGKYSSVTTPVVFQKSGSGANPVITAFTPGTSTTLDGIITIAGGDYITFDGIDVQENPLNTTPSMQMEWGYGLLKKNATAPVDGCQNVVIKNCTITLNKSNTASMGIHFGNHTAGNGNLISISAGSADAHTYCKIYGNTISNVYTGIDMEGYSNSIAGYDQWNEIGVTSGNTISNFGGGSLTAQAIYASYQHNLTISNNHISGGTGSTNYLCGINLGSGTGSNADITGNSISLNTASSHIFGIYNAMGTAGATSNTINISNNTIENLTSTLVADSYMYGIYQIATANTIHINGNTVRNFTKPGTGQIHGLFLNNAAVSGIENVADNQIYNLSSTGATSIYGIENYPSATTVSTVSGNLIHGLSSVGGNNYGMEMRSMATANVTKNKIYGIASSVNGSTIGINLYSNATVNVYNNFISDLQIPANANNGFSMAGIWVYSGTTVNLFNNTVYLNSATPNVSYSVSALCVNSNTTTLTLKNNILISLFVSTGTFRSTAFYRTGTDLTNYLAGSDNNLFYAGNPGPNNLLFSNGASICQTLASLKTLLTPREANSVTELPQFTDPANSDLHIQQGLETACESGGQVISTPVSITDDIDGDARYPNAGYPVNVLDLPTAPDIGADEFAGGHFHTPPVIAFTPLNNPITIASQTLTATITDATSGVPISGTGLPVLYWKRNNAVSYTAAQGISIGSNQYTFTFGSGVVSGDVVYYYIVAQGTWPIPNIGAYPSLMAWGFTPNPPAASVPPSNPSSYIVQSPLAGVVTVGTGGRFPNLTGTSGLFQNLNTCGLEGNLIATIQSDLTEPGTYALNQWTETGAGNYTLTIQPDATTQRVISATAVAAATPMINFNGADRVTINGGSGKYLLFRNTNSSTGSTGPAIQFTNGATADSIKNSVIESNGSSSSQGVVSIGNSGTNSVYIGSCDLHNPTGGSAGLPYCGVYSTNPNNMVNVQYNNIYNWSNTGIYLNNVGNGCIANGNNLYETSVQSATLYGIYVSGGSGHTITNNNFGGSNASRTGAAISTPAGVFGIFLSVGTSSPTSVQGNHLSNFGTTGSNPSAAVFGIQVINGNVNIGTVTGNVFGGGALPSDTIRSGYDNGIIYCTSTGIINIENNTIGNISHWVGGNDRTAGMFISAGTVHIKNNIVRDIKSNSTGTGYAWLPEGIHISTSGSLVNPVIEGNTISNIWNFNTGSGAFTVTGLNIQIPGVSNIIVRNNNISNIYALGTGTGANSPLLYGIYNFGTATSVYNNMISLGQSPATPESRIYGILDASNTSTYYFNSVSIQGTAAGSNGSYAFYCSNLGTVTVKNNIFSNTRNGGSILPYAILSTVQLTSNYNDLYSSGTPLAKYYSTTCNTLAAWKAASSQDANSVSGDPGYTGMNDLHINLATISPVQNAGVQIPAVLTDYDGGTRNNPPDIGADEYTVPPVIVTSAASLITTGSATLNGSVNSQYETAAASFEYGTTASYGQTVAATPATISGNAVTTITAALSPLVIGTLYHFRAVATIGNVPFYGADMTFVTVSGPKTLNLTSVMLEGLYAGSGTMNYAYDENGHHWPGNVADHITVELHSSLPGYYSTIVYTASDVPLSTTGTASVSIPGTFNGTYFITVKHRNSLETVGAAAQSFAGSTVSLSFATPADVYGGNLLAMSDGGYAIYGGDVSQDGAINQSDFVPVNNQAAAFATGYLPEDVNGDGSIDLSDFIIIDNNAAASVGAVTP